MGLLTATKSCPLQRLEKRSGIVAAPAWRRRTNVWRKGTRPARGPTGSEAQFRARPTGETPLRGQRCRSFTALWRREVALKLNMSWQPSRPVFFSLPAYRSRGVPGQYFL
jgi:hypothetical protein